MGIISYAPENPKTFNEFFRNLIIQYKEAVKEKSKEYAFLYEALGWIGGFTIHRFVTFMSVLKKSSVWQEKIINELITIVKNDPNFDGYISFSTFIKFILNCKSFTLQ